jgi:PKD repeat protein
MVTTGDTVGLNGTASYDPDGLIVGWEWNASSSNPATTILSATNVSVITFTAPDVAGVYAFSLKVLDDNGTWSEEDQVNVTVTLPTNVPPVAVATADPAITLGDTLSLNGSASYDADGTIQAWEWNCTSHTSLSIADADSAMATVVPETVGTHTFTLAVQDDRGDWSELVAISVMVLAPDVNIPPVAVIDGPASEVMVVNSTVLIDGSGSRDDDGTIAEFLWNVTPTANATFTGQNTPSIELTAHNEGDIVITLAVRDDNGSWSIHEALVIKTALYPPPPPPPNEPPVPVIDGPDGPVLTGSQVVLDGSSSSDPDGEVVDYGWVSISHISLQIYGHNTSTITFTPEEETEYTITLRVLDDDGEWSAAAVFVVIAQLPPPENMPPQISVLIPSEGDIDLQDGEFIYVEWTASDPNGDELTFVIDLYSEGNLVETHLGFDNITRGTSLPIEVEALAGTMLVVVVTAIETSTTEELEATATSEEFWYLGEVDEPLPDPPMVDDDESMVFPWLLLTLVVAVIIVVVVVVVLMSYARSPPVPPAMASHVAATGMTACPECGGHISHDNPFGQPYCPECDRFF